MNIDLVEKMEADLSRNNLIFPEVIDNSMRKELVKCQMAAKYHYEMGLQPVGESRVDLVAGAALAKGMETVRKAYYIDGLTEMEAIDRGIAAVVEKYGDFKTKDKEVKTAAGMSGAMVYYFQKNPLSKEPLVPLKFPDGSWGIEMQFAYEIPILHPDTNLNKYLKYGGRFDVLARDQVTGKVWVIDEKSTRMYGARKSNDWTKWANQWPLDSQMSGYVWGARKILQEKGLPDLEVAGAVINGIAIGVENYDSIRIPTHREPWMVDRWFDQMLKDVAMWKEAHRHSRHNMALDHACAYYGNPCAYDKLCTKKNPERFVDGNYAVKFWDPTKRDED